MSYQGNGTAGYPLEAFASAAATTVVAMVAGLLGSINTAIDALPNPIKEAAQIEWEYSQEVQRHNGFVSQLAPILGLTEAQLDGLFVIASGL
jgi:hypothetical protein